MLSVTTFATKCYGRYNLVKSPQKAQKNWFGVQINLKKCIPIVDLRTLVLETDTNLT